jgi:uncharacterized protein YndB with AHSA1/START domain
VDTSIRIYQPLSTPPDRVWRACVDPDLIACWQADEAFGKVEPGGKLVLRWPALDAAVQLDVLEVLRHERVVLENARSRVEFLLMPDGLAVTHDGLEYGDEADGVASSWRLSLGLLAHYLERHWGKRRKVRWFVRSLRTSAETAHVYFSEAAGLGKWLASHGEIGARGTEYRLHAAWGEAMSGRVLSQTTGRDVLLTWEEDASSTLAFRTLPSPRDPDQRLLAVVWSRFGGTEPSEERCAGIETAVDRLARVLDRVPTA